MEEDRLDSCEPEAALVLADGQVFVGVALGAPGCAVGEVVFNTAMSGYQEVLTDPSYCGQMVTMTYPHIGNVGINREDHESERCWLSGLIIREYSAVVSNWRSQMSLSAFLAQQGCVAIAGVDTRRLTRHLREHGAMPGCITTTGDVETATRLAAESCGLVGVDLTQKVTTSSVYQWDEGVYTLPDQSPVAKRAHNKHIVLMDFGVKRQILRLLAARGCRVTVVPAKTSSAEVLALQPDGIFLSNGPGDPAACQQTIETVRALIATRIPMAGICLGFQIIALACGARTQKMKFGHHGANHPVQCLATGRVLITSQNHSFCVDKASLPAALACSHVSLFDQTLQGFYHRTQPLMAFQGHPEAQPGPEEMSEWFDHYVELVLEEREIYAKTE